MNHQDDELKFVIDKQGNQHDDSTENKNAERIIYERDTRYVLSPRKRKISSGFQSSETENEDVIEIRSTTCFNCKGPHSLKECPFPINRQVVSANRRQFLMEKPKDKRYWEEDIGTKFEVGVLSPQLKAALGIDDSQDPPYLARMFQHGFPPAYMKSGNVNPFYAKYQAMVNEANEWYDQITPQPPQPAPQPLPQPVPQYAEHYHPYYSHHYNQQQYYYQYECVNVQANPHDMHPRTTYEPPTKHQYTPVRTSSSTTPVKSTIPTKEKVGRSNQSLEKDDSDMEVEEDKTGKKKPPIQEELEEGEIRA